MSRSVQTRSPKDYATDLNMQAHHQIMDYLDVAAKSDNPAIVDAALDLAKERQKQHIESTARLSPRIATLLVTLAVIAAAIACGFVYINYPNMAWPLAGIFIVLAILLICVYSLFTGHLSQANFMSVVKWLLSWVKSESKSRRAALDKRQH